jgi:DNA-binding CsgD family transcriptional regulator
MLDDQIHAVIADIYDTTIDAELTPQVLRKICNLTGSTQGIFHYSSAARLQLRTTFGVDPTLMPLGQQYHDQNEYLKRQHLVPVGRAILGSELVPDEEIRKTAFYNEVLRVTGMVHLLGVAIQRNADLFAALGVWRPESAEPHGAKERAIADALAVHLHQAFAIGSRMHEVMAQSDRLEDALHALAVGCIIVDTRGRLMFANLEATRRLGHNAALRVVQGRLVAGALSDQKRLEEALSRLQGEGAQGSTLLIGRGREATVRFHVVPLTPTRVEAGGLRPTAMRLGLVLLLDPDRPPASPATALRGAYGLTLAEADLAAALLAGDSLKGYAERRRRSINTVKTHLRAVFAKTDTARQSEFMRRLAPFTTLRL